MQEGIYDLAILGTHGRRGPSRLWLGSVTERVLRAATLPVLAVRDGVPPAGIERIFCPVTAGGASERALAYAVSVAEKLGAELHVLRAVDGNEAGVAECPGASEAMRARCKVVEKTVRGRPVASFIEGARESRADLVVLGGEHPESLLAEISSTTTDQILRKMATPLLVVPA
jgi:nucleotide-binding universal stress UspA family protein